MFWKKKKPPKPTREIVMAQAKEAMAQKRAEVGDEALDQIKSAILRRETAPLAQAKKKIMQGDQDKMRDNLNLWLRE